MTRRYGQSTGRVIVRGAQGVLVSEHDFISCPHCEAVIRLKPGTNQPEGEQAWCDHCGTWVCPTEACLRCAPFEQQIEQRLKKEKRERERQNRRDDFARAAGLAR